jgi:hypothetical protein
MGERLRIGTLVLVAVAGTMLAACKPHASRAPRRDVSGMTVDQIERELAKNREDLEAAGVWVPEPAPAASAPPESPPADPGTETPPPEPEPGPAPEEDEPEPDEPSPEPATTADAVDAPSLGRSRRSRVDRESRREAATRCDRICDLADVTCDLQDQICSLTARHAHEVRYQAACARAELQCEASERECELCSE